MESSPAEKLSKVLFYCDLFRKSVIDEKSLPFSIKLTGFLNVLDSHFKKKPPEYLTNLSEDMIDMNILFQAFLENEGLNLNLLQGEDFLKATADETIKLIHHDSISHLRGTLKILRPKILHDIVGNFLADHFFQVTQSDQIASTSAAHSPEQTGLIKFIDADAFLRYLVMKTSDEETRNFIYLIELIHRYPGRLKQFIAVYGPSFIGKTQLAFSLDKFTEYRLLIEEAPPSLTECPLTLCLRIACEIALSKNCPSVDQAINDDFFLETLYKVVESDCKTVDRITDSENLDDESISKSYSVGQLDIIFSTERSNFLGFLVKWIEKRKNGDESTLLKGREHHISFTFTSKTIGDLDQKLRIINSKPYVIVLDEYTLEQADVGKKKKLLFLRNILRACGFVVVLMGTNASALNMTNKISLGSTASGLADALWAQIVLNIYSPPVEDLMEEISTQVTANMRPILEWIKNTNCCLRPGFLRQFLALLQQQSTSNLTPVDLLDDALTRLNLHITKRKPTYSSLEWLLGQVRALLNGVCCDQPLNESLELMGMLKKDDSTLLNSHYAYLDSHSRHQYVPVFSLYRTRIRNRLHIRALGWKQSSDPSNQNDILLSGPAVDALSGNKPIEIKNYLENSQVLSPCISSSINETDSDYTPGCGYPRFENDELGYLAFFHSKNPFAFDGDFDKFKLPNIKLRLFMDLKQKFASEIIDYLSTRAAFTVAFRCFCGNKDVDDFTVQGGSKSGSFLEIVSHAAFVIASYKFGLSGSSFSEFLPQFISELSFKNVPALMLSEDSIVLLGSLANCRIPFFPLIHTTCSKQLHSVPGVHTGTMKMCKNPDQIDGIGYADCLADLELVARALSDLIFSSEQKNYRIGFNIIESCIKKAIENQNALIAEAREGSGIKAELPRLRKPSHHIHFLIAEGITDLTSESRAILKKSYKNISFLVARRIADQVIDLVQLSDYANPSPTDPRQESEEPNPENPKQESKDFTSPKQSSGDTDITITKEAIEDPEVQFGHSAPLRRRSARAAAKNATLTLKNVFTAQEKNQDKGEEEDKPTVAEIPTTFVIIPFRTLFPDDGPMTFTGAESSVPAKRPH